MRDEYRGDGDQLQDRGLPDMRLDTLRAAHNSGGSARVSLRAPGWTPLAKRRCARCYRALRSATRSAGRSDTVGTVSRRPRKI